MVVPNFLVIGTVKGGTTTLYQMLRQHPEVFMPDLKEPYYFSEFRPTDRAPIDWNGYKALFGNWSGQQAVGEASAGYLYSKEAASRIKNSLGAVKLIAMLRHPVDRAYSMYWHRRRDAEEHLSFLDAVKVENQRIGEGYSLGWHYISMGHYKEQLDRYLRLFELQDIKVLCFEYFISHPEETMVEIADFLDIDSSSVVWQVRKDNPNYQIRLPLVESILRRVGSSAPARLKQIFPKTIRDKIKKGIRELNRREDGYIPLDKSIRYELGKQFKDDIAYLIEEIDRRFEIWRGK